MSHTTFLLFILASLLPSHSFAQSGAIIYVAPEGLEKNIGLNQNKPTSLKNALNLIKSPQNPKHIILLPGIYYLDKTLNLEEQHSGTVEQPTIIEGSSLGEVRISGGIEIKGAPSKEDPTLDVYPLQKKTPLFRQVYQGTTNKNEMLRLNRAQTETHGTIISWLYDYNNGIHIRSSELPEINQTFEAPYPELKIWRFWAESYARIESIKTLGNGEFIITLLPDDRDREMNRPVPFREEGQPVWISNLRSALTHSNEWIYDAKEKVVLVKRENEKLGTLPITIPVQEQLISLKNAHDILFKNIIFEHSNWSKPSEVGVTGVQGSYFYSGPRDQEKWFAQPGAITLQNTDRITFYNNLFRHLGANGLELISGTRNTMIEGNKFFELAGGAIEVYTDTGDFIKAPNGKSYQARANPDPAYRSSHDTIRDNFIQKTGLDYSGTAGIFATYPENLTIEHNEVWDLPYTGISVGWGWTNIPSALKENLILNNYVHDVMKKLDDGAGIYLLSKQPGTVVKGNRIGSLTPGSFSGQRPVVAIYLDNDAEEISVLDNQCEGKKYRQQTEFGIFYRPETKKLNQISYCLKSNDQLSTIPGPRIIYQSIREIK